MEVFSAFTILSFLALGQPTSPPSDLRRYQSTVHWIHQITNQPFLPLFLRPNDFSCAISSYTVVLSIFSMFRFLKFLRSFSKIKDDDELPKYSDLHTLAVAAPAAPAPEGVIASAKRPDLPESNVFSHISVNLEANTVEIREFMKIPYLDPQTQEQLSKDIECLQNFFWNEPTRPCEMY